MTYNIGDLNGQRPVLDNVVKTIARHGVPDLIFLQEVNDEPEVSCIASSLGLAHYVFHPYKQRNKGPAILSRHPLSDPETLNFKASPKGYCALTARVRLEGFEMIGCSLHLDSVREVKNNGNKVGLSLGTGLKVLRREVLGDTARSRSVEELLAWMAGRHSHGIIFGGDFNTIPFSKTIRKMSDRYRNAGSSLSDYLTGTYKKSSLPLAPRIDFIFHSRNIGCRGAHVVKQSDGDHFPVRAVFELGS